MDDAFFVGCGQSVRDLHGVVEGFADRDRSGAEAIPQRFALEQLRDNVRRAVTRADVEYCENVWMIQSGSSESFLLEAAHAIGVQRKRLRQNFDGDFTAEARVAGAIDLAHASCA